MSKVEKDKEVPVKAGSPLVLQCRRCWRILGDNWAFESSDPVANTISLRGVSNVSMVDHPVVSKDGSGNGSPSSSSNVKLKCVGCESVVGKVVMAATQQNFKNNLRGLFVLDMKAISSCELGVPELYLGDLDVNTAAPSSKQYTPFQNDTAVAASEDVWTEIEKIEKVILALNDRLHHLEKLNGVTLKQREVDEGAQHHQS